jgi:hypothetical protein
MAIDTAEKRRSLSFVVVVSPGVTPNSSKDAEWRREVGYGYPFGDSEVPPAFDVDHEGATIKMEDLGLHLIQTDLAWKVASSAVDQFNLNSADVGWKVKHTSKRWNIKEG